MNIDISSFIQPISEDLPCGEDLRSSDTDSEISLLFEQAKKSKEPGAWRPVISKSLETTKSKSKDIRYLAFIIQGMTIEYGYTGLRDGFELTRNMLEKYWDNIYPRPEGDDYSDMLGFLKSLDGKGFITLLQLTTLVDGGNVGPYGLWHFNESNGLAALDENKRAKRVNEGIPEIETMKMSALDTPFEVLKARYEAIKTTKDHLEKLRQIVLEKTGKMHLTFSQIDNILENAQQAIEFLVGQNYFQQTDEADNAVDSASENSSPANANKSAKKFDIKGDFNSREDALAVLLKIADFFQKTEPQSIIPAQLRRVVKWARLSPDDLFKEVIDDSSVLEKLYKLVGIKLNNEE